MPQSHAPRPTPSSTFARLVLGSSLLVGSLCVAVGCSTPNYGAKHRASLQHPPSEAFDGDIKFDEKVKAIAYYAYLPGKGALKFDEERGELLALEGSGYTVLTRVQLNFPVMENPALLWWFYKYRPEEKWRRGLCYWQVPLTWITLGIWAIVPLNYPCHSAIWHTGSMREIAGKEQREEIMKLGLKAEAVRLGGNAVVLGFVADQGATGWIVQMPAP